jgi:acyl carrier protein
MKGKLEIHEFVHELLARSGDDGPLADNESLLLGGRLQSIDAVEIVLFLEDNFGIDFAEIGFDKDQIDSIDAIYAITETATDRNQAGRNPGWTH